MIYAFLVGIDKYPEPLRPLRGCVNDVRQLEAWLRAHIKNETALECDPILILINEQATRSAVIGGFREHLRKARANDCALFYFSGHGSQEQTPCEFWGLEPDHLNETLICYDSRT